MMLVQYAVNAQDGGCLISLQEGQCRDLKVLALQTI